jgi:hypothetical protein
MKKSYIIYNQKFHIGDVFLASSVKIFKRKIEFPNLFVVKKINSLHYEIIDQESCYNKEKEFLIIKNVDENKTNFVALDKKSLNKEDDLFYFLKYSKIKDLENISFCFVSTNSYIKMDKVCENVYVDTLHFNKVRVKVEKGDNMYFISEAEETYCYYDAKEIGVKEKDYSDYLEHN